jgi:hypothetical protein
MKTKWKILGHYHSQEFILKDRYVLYKDWFDPGKNPNTTKLYFEDILSGKHDYFFTMEFAPSVKHEIKEAVKKIINQN